MKNTKTSQNEGSTDTEALRWGVVPRDAESCKLEFGFHSKNSGKPFNVLKQGSDVISVAI